MYFIYLTFSFISIIFLSLLFVLGVKQNIYKDLRYCTTQMSELQHSHKKLTKSLIGKNPYALGLRISRALAEVAYKAAPDPISKSAALTALQVVKASQKVLTVYQKGLIQAGNLKSYRILAEMTTKGYVLKRKSTGLIVELYPKNSDSPSYRLQKKYQNKKIIVFHKLVNTTKNFPKILIKQFKVKSHFILKCGSTIENKGEQLLKTKLILDN